MEIRKIAILGSDVLAAVLVGNCCHKGYNVTLFTQGAGSQMRPTELSKVSTARLLNGQ